MLLTNFGKYTSQKKQSQSSLLKKAHAPSRTKFTKIESTSGVTKISMVPLKISLTILKVFFFTVCGQNLAQISISISKQPIFNFQFEKKSFEIE